jgi:hypothetical protein
VGFPGIQRSQASVVSPDLFRHGYETKIQSCSMEKEPGLTLTRLNFVRTAFSVAHPILFWPDRRQCDFPPCDYARVFGARSKPISRMECDRQENQVREDQSINLNQSKRKIGLSTVTSLALHSFKPIDMFGLLLINGIVHDMVYPSPPATRTFDYCL